MFHMQYLAELTTGANQKELLGESTIKYNKAAYSFTTLSVLIVVVIYNVKSEYTIMKTFKKGQV